MAIGNVLGVMSTLILENVASAVENLHVDGDRILDFMDTIPVNQKLGTDQTDPFVAEHTLQFNEGGTLTQMAINATTLTSIGTAAWPIGMAADSLAPDPTEAPQPLFKRISIPLRETVGVITVNKDQIFAEDFALHIGEFVQGLIGSVVKKLRNWRASNVYCDSTGWLAQSAGNVTVTNDEEDNWVTIQNGTSRRFEIGERYEAYDADDGSPLWDKVDGSFSTGTDERAQLGDQAMICTDLDHPGNRVLFKVTAGGADAVMVQGDHLVKQGTVTAGVPGTSLLVNGFDNLIGNAGTIHGLDRATYSILKSQVDDDGSATSLRTPRPELITDLLDDIQDAGYEPPSFLVSSRSVRSKYAYNQGGQGAFVLPNYTATADGGIGMVQTTYEDKVFNWVLSAFIEPHTILGIEPSAFTKFAPGGHNVVNWWVSQGGLSGANNIFRPVLGGSGARLSKTFAAEWSSHFNMGILMPFVQMAIRNLKGRRDS